MTNGEGIEEKQSPAVATPGDRESDGGDDLSHYSSCGGESEFERYCSASSAMGTPSFRGTPFHDSDFGSLKNFKLGAENTDFDKVLGAERVFSECGRGGNEFCRDEKGNGRLSLGGGIEGFVIGDVDLRGDLDVSGDWRNGVVTGSEMNEIADGSGRITGDFIGEGNIYLRSIENTSENGQRFEIDGGKDRSLSDEGEASSREHSEGEDSMFGCGSDDERKIDLYYGKNVPFHGDKSGMNENQLVMSSAVAFGSDDWDDFVQQNGENTTDSMIWGEFQAERRPVSQIGTGSSSFTAGSSGTYPNKILTVPQDNAKGTPVACDLVGDCDKLEEIHVSVPSTVPVDLVKLDARFEDAKQVLAARNLVSDIDELDEYLGNASVSDIFQTQKDPLEKAPEIEELRKSETDSVMKNRNVTTREVNSIHHDISSKKRNLDEANPLSDSEVIQNDLVAVKSKEEEAILPEESSSIELPLVADNKRSVTAKNNIPSAFDQIEDHFVADKTRDFELNDIYDEIVNDMEDVLLDSVESPASRFPYSTRISHRQLPRTSRDGSSSASTSGTDYAYNCIQQPLKIDRVEVVGSRQIKGDVSFSERLVGVQKYTVYKIKVWSGEDHWEVERRYREFHTLYYRLKKLCAENGWTLPSSWSSVERESRKLFGNASPDVIAERSVLIQECLQSIISSRFPTSSLSSLSAFLSPINTVPSSPASGTSMPKSPLANRGTQTDGFPTLGKTISLVVQVGPLKSVKQLLDEQHYRCAGCHKSLDDGRTRMQELVQALGWGKPRLCEYSGQLFCSSCHANDTAVLPARVLHHWDFSRYPVSQLAKSFLDSIYEQPMLCVSAVNPFLFSKVTTLQHVANVRNRIRALLPYVRCPFRRSIYKGLGSRRYLLDSNDFFALKDLIDLSKGVFSALPVMVETVSRKIEQHITDHCLICYDVGVPCGARQECQDPLALIFPFQEGEAEKCRSCELVFHKNCFKKLASCPCGVRFETRETKRSADSNVSSSGGMAEPSSGLLSGLFSMVMPGRSQATRKPEAECVSNNVIPMGSLPTTSL